MPVRLEGLISWRMPGSRHQLMYLAAMGQQVVVDDRFRKSLFRFRVQRNGRGAWPELTSFAPHPRNFAEHEGLIKHQHFARKSLHEDGTHVLRHLSIKA